MNIIPTGVQHRLYRGALILKKNAPTIMFVAGIGGTVTSTVMACRATLQLAEHLPNLRSELEAVHGSKDDMSEEEYKKAIAMAYGLNAAHVVRLYAPAAIVGTVSVGLLTGSHVIISRREASVTAALAAFAKFHEDYRNRVQQELGEDKERDVYRGAATETIIDEKGKEKKVKVYDPNKLSPYAKVFDESNVNWEDHNESNMLFLRCAQQYANDRLHAKGFVILNDVYKHLGFEETSAGTVVGWVLTGDPDVDGDGFVSFGIFDESPARFANGLENSIILDFNVDGVVNHLIGKKF